MPDVYVSALGLMVNITKHDLMEVFRKYGRVRRIETYEGRDYGFVEMDTEEGARNAISGVNGTILRGCYLHVRYGHNNNNAVSKSDGDYRIVPKASKYSKPCKRPSGDQRELSHDSWVIVSRTRGNDGRASVINQTEIGDHSDNEGQLYSVKRARRDVSNGIAPDLVLLDGNVRTSFSHSSALNGTNNSVNETSHSTSSQSTKSKKKTLGAETFEAVRGSKFFIDRTKLIKEIVEVDAKTILITAPARFGKSVNLAMLKSFLSARITKDGHILPPQPIEESAFRGTEIAKDTEFISLHFQRYIVLFVDFAEALDNSEEAILALRSSVISVYEEHSYLKNHLDENDLLYFENFTNHFYKMDAVLVQMCLLELAQMLHNYHNDEKSDAKPAQFKHEFVLLVDEFDAPIINTMFSVDAETLRSIANLRDGILCEMTKTSDGDELLFMSVFTGVADICCPTTSTLGNLVRYDVLSSKKKNVFAPYYGVSKKELKP